MLKSTWDRDKNILGFKPYDSVAMQMSFTEWLKSFETVKLVEFKFSLITDYSRKGRYPPDCFAVELLSALCKELTGTRTTYAPILFETAARTRHERAAWSQELPSNPYRLEMRVEFDYSQLERKPCPLLSTRDQICP